MITLPVIKVQAVKAGPDTILNSALILILLVRVLRYIEYPGHRTLSCLKYSISTVMDTMRVVLCVGWIGSIMLVWCRDGSRSHLGCEVGRRQ